MVVCIACGDDNEGSPTAPTPPTIITETFAGTVTRNGGSTHTFSSQASGTVTATLTLLAAPEGTKVGFALGTSSPATGATCQLIITKDDAIQGSSVVGAVSALGSLCVRVYDVGNLTQSADYEISVSHP